MLELYILPPGGRGTVGDTLANVDLVITFFACQRRILLDRFLFSFLSCYDDES